MKEDQEFIERRIVTGLIVSPEYLERIHLLWNPTLLESPEIRTVASWCIDYFEQYKTAPDTNIQDIYLEQLRSGKISRSEGQYIEELLDDLSEEYGRGTKFNAAYLYDRTIQYFKSQELELHNRQVQNLIDRGEIEEAEKLASSYKPTILEDKEIGLELSSEEAKIRMERAFQQTYQPVISYPGALGEMLNSQLIRGGFVTFLGSEKRGKSYFLLDMAMRAIRQKANVAFFEAGDMTEAQVLRRIGIYTAQRSDRIQNCQARYRPVGDCFYNQNDTCTRPDRNCDHGIHSYEKDDYNTLFHESSPMQVLIDWYEANPDYEPCDSSSCPDRRGAVWIKSVKKCRPLNGKQAAEKLGRFFERYKRRFKLTSYAAGTLTVSEIKRVLNAWERRDGFVPDVVVVDYADLLSADDGKVSEFRHRQDHIWKSLRALSQEWHVLVLSATQADAASYTKDRLSLVNFSEDKRKLAHVTAQYGLNQDSKGIEKELGILRVNEIVVREGAFSANNEVYVLQDLAIGRPFLESFTKNGGRREIYDEETV